MKHALAILLLSASVVFGQTLTNTNLDGVTNATLNGKLDDDTAASRTALGLGTAATADVSTTGGANKIIQLGGSGIFRTTAVNNSDVVTPPAMTVANRQRLAYETGSGSTGADIWLYQNHGLSGGKGGSAHELIYGAGRHCFYWDDGMQIGNADAVPGSRFVYLRGNGNASATYPVIGSVPVWFDGAFYNGTGALASSIGMQWVGSGQQAGELVFGITGTATLGAPPPLSNTATGGFVSNVSGIIRPFSITQDGPKVGTGKVLTFGDGSTMSNAPNLQARTGNATLVAGTVTVADATTTAYSNILLTRRAAGGTIGDLTYAISNGVGFTINSASATDTSRVTYHLVESLTAASAASISGTNGITDTLTVTSGGGSGTWQWYSNGVLVSGQTASTYVIRHQDIGLAITCREDGIASNAITAWHPDDEAGYFADYRADQGTLKTGGAAAANGEAVETWQDQSGNARHLSQVTGTKQPLLDTSGTGGRPPLLDFDATDDGLARTISVLRPYSVFLVAEADTDRGALNFRFFSTASSGSRMQISQFTPTTARYFDSTTALDATGQVNLDERHILFGKTSASLNEFKVDGNTTLSNATGTSANGSEILVSQSAAGGGADIKAYALLIYTADLDSAAQTRVRKYLKAKWGTP
jgi:hypothetical protein